MLLNQDESCLVLVDIQEKLTPHVLGFEALISRCLWLQNLARKRRVPVLLSEQYPSGLGPTVQPLLNGFDLQDKIEKTHFSCMQAPGFIERLQQLNKSHYILIGIETHVCILQTALEMREAGLSVFVVVDAVSSRNIIDHKYGLKRLKQAGVHLITAEMVFFEWIRDAATPEFKALSKEFLQ